MARPKSEMDFREVLSKRLNDELERKKDQNPSYRQKDFADELGIDASTLSKYISMDRQTSIETLYKLSEYFDCNIEWLIRDDVSKQRIPSETDVAIENMSKITKFPVDILNKFANGTIGESDAETLSFLINDKDFFENLMSRIRSYLDFNEYIDTYAYVSLANESMEMELDEDSNYVIKRNCEDYLEHFGGGMIITGKRFEELLFDDILAEINKIKHISKYEIVHLKEYISYKKREYKMVEKDIEKVSAGIDIDHTPSEKKDIQEWLYGQQYRLKSILGEIETIKHKIKEIEKEIKERKKYNDQEW